jgi:hypothetical protein
VPDLRKINDLRSRRQGSQPGKKSFSETSLYFCDKEITYDRAHLSNYLNQDRDLCFSSRNRFTINEHRYVTETLTEIFITKPAKNYETIFHWCRSGGN